MMTCYIHVCVCAGGLGWWAITKSDSPLMCHPWESVQADRMKVNGYLSIRVGCETALWAQQKGQIFKSLFSPNPFYSQMSVSTSKLKGVINTKLLPFNFSPSTSLRDVCNCDSCSTSVDINGEKKYIPASRVNSAVKWTNKHSHDKQLYFYIYIYIYIYI